MTWTIVPYERVGSLRFGMSPSEVADLVGPPQATQSIEESLASQPEMGEAYAGITTEFRGSGKKAGPIASYRDGKLISVDFDKNTKGLILDGLDLFSGKRQATIDALIDRSTVVFENFEGYVFLDFGLYMMNSENFRSNPNINVFERGGYDREIKGAIADDLGEYIKGGP